MSHKSCQLELPLGYTWQEFLELAPGAKVVVDTVAYPWSWPSWLMNKGRLAHHVVELFYD